jgi:4-amino-4-deoxy-L-arabinose transferase-like glycosyltransferase
MITACCFYIIYSANVKDMRSREVFIYPLLMLGFAFRGPIGLVIPTGVICAYYLQDANFKKLFFYGMFAILILVICTLLLLTLADIYGGHEFVHDVLRMEVVGRMEKSHLPVYFYFTNGLRDYALSFPLALMTALGIIYYEQRLHYHTPELKLLLKLFGWILVVMIGMSIPGDKKIRYILPIAPAIALLAAYPFIAPKGERYFSCLRWALLRLFIIFPVILFIGLRLVMSYAAKHAMDFNINYLLMTQILFGALACSFLVFFCLGKKEKWRDTGVLLIATFSFVLCYLTVAEPIEQYIDKTHQFVMEVEQARKHNHAKLVFYRETPDSLPIKYLINMPTEETPDFIQDEQGLMMYSSPAFFVTSEAYFKELSPVTAGQLHVIARDKIGHVPVVVFTNR